MKLSQKEKEEILKLDGDSYFPRILLKDDIDFNSITTPEVEAECKLIDSYHERGLAGPGMTLERYDDIERGYLSLTQKEIDAGWHFCYAWDGLLIHESWGEAKFCDCRKK